MTMTHFAHRLVGAIALTTAATLAPISAAHAAPADEPLVAAFDQTTSATPWSLQDIVDFKFDILHPQAMEVTKDRIYISSVGADTGHIFVLDRQGNLLRDINVTDGPRYHPGGLDVHGNDLYVAVAEYRPDSTATVMHINLTTFEVTPLFKVNDHLGGVIYDEVKRRIVGQSWGSRRFYEWTLSGHQTDFWLNPTTYTDYQDCEYVVYRKMLCNGPGGWFDMVVLSDRTVRHALQVPMKTDNGKSITANPADIDAEVTAGGTRLTLYGAPDDNLDGEMYVYTTNIAG
jgi:hypothetical protein